MKRLAGIAVLVVLLGGCSTEREKTVTPNQACAGHSGVKSVGQEEWSKDNIGWNGNEPNWYTVVVCRDGFVGTAVNWQ